MTNEQFLPPDNGLTSYGGMTRYGDINLIHILEHVSMSWPCLEHRREQRKKNRSNVQFYETAFVH